jgi:predicted metal-dependent HD superfamily phosphohydrolase
MNKFWRQGIELQSRWFRLFDKLGIRFDYESEESGTTSLSFEFLQTFYRYSENHRYYHTPKHLLDCLEEFDKACGLAEDPNAIESALWFHDIVYDTRAKDNEEESAKYARKVLYEFKLPELFVEKTVNLVLVTKHIIEPRTIDEKVIVDIDLSIFGKPQGIFDEYEAGIRKEYCWASESEFKAGRAKILEYFLNRDAIYKTAFFKDLYEEQARRNLERSIEKLRS